MMPSTNAQQHEVSDQEAPAATLQHCTFEASGHALSWAHGDDFIDYAAGAEDAAQACAIAGAVVRRVGGDAASLQFKGSSPRAWFFTFRNIHQPLFLKVPATAVAARMPGELVGARYAASRGIGPAVVPVSGIGYVLLSHEIQGEHLHKSQLHEQPLCQRVLRQLRLLHREGAAPGAQAAHNIIDKAQGRRNSFIAANIDSPVPLERIDAALSYFAAVLGRRAAALQLCHNDFTHQNIAEDAGGTLYFVDWDIFGPGHPFEEIARLMLLVDLPRSDLGQVLMEYLGRLATPDEQAELSATLGVLETEFYFYTGAMPGDNPDIADFARMGERMVEAISAVPTLKF